MIKEQVSKRVTSVVGLAMRKPISVCVLVLAMAMTASLAIKKMPRDILPNLAVPIIYVAQPYGGLDPGQMESYVTYFYEYHFLYISGIEHIESKNIESTALIKLQFQPGTDMAEAMSETVAEVNRSRAFMPPGTNPPFVLRFDAGSEPVGKLVFSSESRSLGDMQNYALNFVRPLFASLSGVSAPPPFGASARTIVIEVDPKKLANNDLSPDAVTRALVEANTIIPSGNIHTGKLYPLVPINAIVKDPKELLDVPLRLGKNHSTLIGDVATIKDATDIPTGYALVNGRRTIYIPITKRADASTLSVVDLVKENIPRFQSVLPDDIKVAYEFDQSGYVRRSISSLFVEALLGALFTGVMVFLFLRDMRSVAIVVLNIPLALLSAILALWISGQTINIMTLGGLALAVGILVDETTVTIENIHAHLAQGKPVARAVLDATNEILKPALLTLLCVLSVFIPSFFMEGVTHSLFIPLTLSVGFAVIGSFVLSITLVPVTSTWFLKVHEQIQDGLFHKFQQAYSRVLAKLMGLSRTLVVGYLLLAIVVIAVGGKVIGTEIFPQVDVGQFQLRIRGPSGTSIEYTEQSTLKIIEIIKKIVSAENVDTTVAFVGMQPPNYAISTVYLWTSGPHEAVLEVALKESAKMTGDDFKEKLRAEVAKELPEVLLSFEPSNLVDRSMSQGSTTPIEIAVSGRVIDDDESLAKEILASLKELPYLRDQQIVQRTDYPTLSVETDRHYLGVKGLTVNQIGQSLIPATSSSRYIVQNYWRDLTNGVNYQVQVQVPQSKIKSIEDLENIPIPSMNGDSNPLKNYAKIVAGKKVGEYDRYNMQRTISVTANLQGIDLGHAAQEINRRISALMDKKPKGVEVHTRGQMPALSQMMGGLSFGLLLAIVVVLLLLSANFESLSLAFCVLSSVPAVISGALLMLLATRTTLNIESFMGTIMAIGVAMANAILLVTFAERARKNNLNASQAAIEGAQSRLRPILMTSCAMLVGMLPMASGFGEGGEQTAPLGRAVLGGIFGSTLATLFILPLVFAWIQRRRNLDSSSLDPNDQESRHFSE